MTDAEDAQAEVVTHGYNSSVKVVHFNKMRWVLDGRSFSEWELFNREHCKFTKACQVCRNCKWWEPTLPIGECTHKTHRRSSEESNSCADWTHGPMISDHSIKINVLRSRQDAEQEQRVKDEYNARIERYNRELDLHRERQALDRLKNSNLPRNETPGMRKAAIDKQRRRIANARMGFRYDD